MATSLGSTPMVDGDGLGGVGGAAPGPDIVVGASTSSLVDVDAVPRLAPPRRGGGRGLLAPTCGRTWRR
jgi:hypothetical protein